MRDEEYARYNGITVEVYQKLVDKNGNTVDTIFLHKDAYSVSNPVYYYNPADAERLGIDPATGLMTLTPVTPAPSVTPAPQTSATPAVTPPAEITPIPQTSPTPGALRRPDAGSHHPRQRAGHGTGGHVLPRAGASRRIPRDRMTARPRLGGGRRTL